MSVMTLIAKQCIQLNDTLSLVPIYHMYHRTAITQADALGLLVSGCGNGLLSSPCSGHSEITLCWTSAILTALAAEC